MTKGEGYGESETGIVLGRQSARVEESVSGLEGDKHLRRNYDIW